MTIIIRRNSSLLLETQGSRYGILAMPRLVSGSVGINGSLKTARCLALNGAELLFYPTAIGSEPILDTDSCGHWQRTMQGHAAANIVPVIAANRYGLEEVTPCEEMVTKVQVLISTVHPL